MKRVTIFILIAMLASSLSLGFAPAPAKAQAGIKIGLVTDVGKVDDRSFNQSAWEGTQDAAKAVGGEAKYIETTNPGDYANNINQFVEQEYNIIITVGFALGDATAAAAKQHPDIQFIGVDQFQGAEIANVTGLIFDEAKAGFLGGVLAARMSKSGTIAQVLGTDQVPPVVAFKEGFEAGAKYAKPDIKVISTYHPGGLDKAFDDPQWGAQTAGQAIDQNADVVFGAGGKTGNGALTEVAKRTTKDKPLFCIGVDTDQWETVAEAHPCLISSAMKLIKKGVVDLVKMYVDKTIKGGNFIGDVDLAPYHDFDTVIPEEVKTEISKVREDLLGGKLDPRTGKPIEAMPAATPAK